MGRCSVLCRHVSRFHSVSLCLSQAHSSSCYAFVACLQYFKANLLADMLVVKLLDIEQRQLDTQLPSKGRPSAGAPAPPAYTQKAASAAAAGGSGGVLAESSFD